MDIEIARDVIDAKPRKLTAKWTVDLGDLSSSNFFNVVKLAPDRWELTVSHDLFYKVKDVLTENYGPGSRNTKSRWRASWSEFSHENDLLAHTAPSKARYRFFIKEESIVTFITLLFS